jgi:hypothetical protein
MIKELPAFMEYHISFPYIKNQTLNPVLSQLNYHLHMLYKNDSKLLSGFRGV